MLLSVSFCVVLLLQVSLTLKLPMSQGSIKLPAQCVRTHRTHTGPVSSDFSAPPHQAAIVHTILAVMVTYSKTGRKCYTTDQLSRCDSSTREVSVMSDAELARRLERLERDNQRLKRGGLAILVLLAALTTIYATRPIPQVIKAHEFEAVDSAGKVRVKMCAPSSDSKVPSVDLYDASGDTEAGIAAAGLWPAFWLSDPQNKASIQMNVYKGNPAVLLEDSGGNIRTSMTVSPSGSPTILLSDPKGFSMSLGVTETVTPRTGQTQKTSADSIIMFGSAKDHHAIWRAP